MVFLVWNFEKTEIMPLLNKTEGKLCRFKRKLHYPSQSRLVTYESRELIKIVPTQSKICSLHCGCKIFYGQKLSGHHVQPLLASTYLQARVCACVCISWWLLNLFWRRKSTRDDNNNRSQKAKKVHIWKLLNN